MPTLMKTKEQKSLFMVLNFFLIAFCLMCNMIWAIASYENLENIVIIHTMAQFTIFAYIIFSVMLLIVGSKI